MDTEKIAQHLISMPSPAGTRQIVQKTMVEKKPKSKTNALLEKVKQVASDGILDRIKRYRSAVEVK